MVPTRVLPSLWLPSRAATVLRGSDCSTGSLMHRTSLGRPRQPPSGENHPMIEPGQPAPDFTLADQHGAKITLSALKGTPVVLYFYPKDDTPGCTKEACAFRDARADYEKAGAR